MSREKPSMTQDFQPWDAAFSWKPLVRDAGKDMGKIRKAFLFILSEMKEAQWVIDSWLLLEETLHEASKLQKHDVVCEMYGLLLGELCKHQNLCIPEFFLNNLKDFDQHLLFSVFVREAQSKAKEARLDSLNLSFVHFVNGALQETVKSTIQQPGTTLSRSIDVSLLENVYELLLSIESVQSAV